MVTGQMERLDFRRHAVSLYMLDRVRNPRDASVYMPAIINPNMQTIGFEMYPGAARQPMGRRDGF
jgi:hypothetical protein